MSILSTIGSALTKSVLDTAKTLQNKASTTATKPTITAPTTTAPKTTSTPTNSNNMLGTVTNSIANNLGNLYNTATSKTGTNSNNSSSAQNAAQVKYYDPNNQLQTGYIIDGVTYTDNKGTNKVPTGSYVQASDGTWYYKDPTSGTGVKQQYSPVNPTSIWTPEGQQYNAFNINGKTYLDEAGTQRLPEGYYTYANGNYYQMGNTGGSIVDTPSFLMPQQQIIPQQIPQQTLPSYFGMEMPTYDTSGIESEMNALLNAIQNYKGADSMSLDEATARAYAQLSSMYNSNLDKSLKEYDKSSISRGMFGQLPTEALKRNAISESELNKAYSINDLAQTLYTNNFNMAQQEEDDFLNNIGQQLNVLGQQYGIQNDKYNAAMNQYNIAKSSSDEQRNEAISMLGQYSNDYMQRINDVTNDGDTSNDWEIPYLTMLRNDKIAGINQSQSKAEAAQYEQALDMFNSLGYASGWIADALGLPEGTKTADYYNMLTDNARMSASASKSGSGGAGGVINTGSPKLVALTPAQMSSYMELATQDIINKKGDEDYKPSRNEIFEETSKLLKALGYDSNAIDEYLKTAYPTNALSMGDFKQFDRSETLIDTLSKLGLSSGNDMYSTMDDYELFKWLNK